MHNETIFWSFEMFCMRLPPHYYGILTHGAESNSLWGHIQSSRY